jgi:cytochrome c5
MKRFKIFRAPLQICWLTLALCGVAGGCASGPKATVARAASENTGTGAGVLAAAANSRAPLTGAELYAVNCNRCHAERYPTERNAAQWGTILTHMRVRANLPAAQAREILKYLQENSGS